VVKKAVKRYFNLRKCTGSMVISAGIYKQIRFPVGKEIDQIDIEYHLKGMRGMLQNIIQSFLKMDGWAVQALYSSLWKQKEQIAVILKKFRTIIQAV